MSSNDEMYWKDELALLHELISSTELEKSTKWGGTVFTLNGKNVLSCGSFKHHFCIWFFNGVFFLSDPYKVLINAQEGKTKAMRQWKFQSSEDIDGSRILKYEKEAIQNEKEGKSWKAQRSSTTTLHPILIDAFKNEINLKKSFEALPLFKQKEFVEYISGAKRETTRLARIQKIIPMIFKGEGLNDKYR